MRIDSRKPRATFAPWLQLTLLVGLAVRLLLLEEEEGEGVGLVGTYRRGSAQLLTGLLPHQSSYLSQVDDLIAGYSENGRRRLRRYYLSSVAALCAAASVPVAVAAGSPGWLVASFGGAAVVAQGLQQVLQDQRLGVASHILAVQLSQSVRRFTYRLGTLDLSSQK